MFRKSLFVCLVLMLLTSLSTYACAPGEKNLDEVVKPEKEVVQEETIVPEDEKAEEDICQLEKAEVEEEESVEEPLSFHIDYYNPGLYLASGNQSSLDKKYYEEVNARISIKENSVEALAEIFRWKQDYFSSSSYGGELIGKRTVNQIMAEKTLSGCHDHALVLASVFRAYGFPSIMVDTAGIKWAFDYSEGKRADLSGHVFVEVYINNKWILINPTSGEYIEDYDPYNQVIPITNSDESTGYFALVKGLDPKEYGITSLQQLRERLVSFAEEARSKEMYFPQYTVNKFPMSLDSGEIELKYDDGSSDGSCSSGCGYGYVVRFSPPVTPFAVNEIKIFANLRGSGYEGQTAIFEIRKWNQNRIAFLSEPAMIFNQEPTWMTVEVADVTVNENFHIAFYPCSTREGGVYLHFDTSNTNRHSEMVEAGAFKDWIWEEEVPKEKTNWMIRVVGEPSDEVVSIPSSTFHMVEGSAEFQETVSLLDSPEKLSHWILENIRGESNYEQEKESGVSYTPPPDEIFETKRGNCRSFAVFAFYVLQYHGYLAEILRISVASDERMNHVLCVYHLNDSLYVINSGRLQGPYQNYEDIAYAHHEKWSSYQIYYAWYTYQQKWPPDKRINRDE